MMKKKLIAILLTLGCVFALTACGLEIPDENGPEDYSLATITEENLIQMDLGASAYSTSPGSDEDDYMYKLTKVKGKEFSGVVELWGTNLLGKSDQTVDLSTIQVDSGNFQLVATLDDEIVHVFDNEEMSQTYELRDANGYFAIRMAGETADFKFFIRVW